jgi:tol-pal system protein YbgF
MKIRNATAFLALVCLAAGAMGCAVADTGAFARLQDEVVVLKKDMAQLKAAPPPAAVAGGGGEGDIQSIRKNLADLTNDSDRMKSDLLAANSRQEDARMEMKRITERQAEQERALQELRKTSDRIKEIDQRLAALEEKAGQAPPAAIGGAAGAAVGAPSEWKSPEEMYEYAVGQVKGGSPKKGRETLTAFIAQYPEHKLVPNALYWKGESYYAEKDYENAILSFQDVVDRYPGADKTPDAVYKQGLSFLALRDTKNAKILLELVVSKYPKSSAAEMARKKLSEIR